MMKKGVNKTKLKKISRREFIVASTITGVSIAVLGCSKSKDLAPSGEQGKDTLYITNIIVPAKVMLRLPADFLIRGNGFANGDKIVFTSLSGTKSITVDVKSVTQNDCAVTIPEAFTSGRYRVEVVRKDKSLYLGETIIEIDYGIADKSGMTVKGMVHVAGTGLAGVVVSDGVEIVTTDENGIYYLPSKKEKDFTFISVPGGYEVETNTVLPVFYKHFEAAADVVETINFELKPVNNDKHVVLALGDMHLANRNNDVSQFQKGFLPDAAQTITKYRNEGYKVYGLTLGDMTWDLYWYSEKFGFAQYLDLVKGMDIPIYHTIGNHDNDPYIDNDWASEEDFRKTLGPTYYSFNIGKVHYIVLDNIEYINTGGTQGKLGSRNYNAVVVANQMAWLKKDLAMIRDKSTPIVLAMHIHLNKKPSVNESSSFSLGNASELIGAFNGFTDVNVITGHTHYCFGYENSNSMMEHNSGAICATWWWTGSNGYAGNNISIDGSPGGYAIWKFNDRNYQWRYKSIGYEEDYQFRAYDLNKVHITAAKFAPKASEADMRTYAKEYADPNTNNEILVNVWGYDKRWKIEMFENGTPLAVTRVSALDPLHIISYEAFRLNWGEVPTSASTSSTTAHMFKAKASGATTPVVIKVTDRFGNVYTEIMNRPKEFIWSMR